MGMSIYEKVNGFNFDHTKFELVVAHQDFMSYVHDVSVCVCVSLCTSVYSYSICVFLGGSLDCMNETVTI